MSGVNILNRRVRPLAENDTTATKGNLLGQAIPCVTGTMASFEGPNVKTAMAGIRRHAHQIPVRVLSFARSASVSISSERAIGIS